MNKKLLILMFAAGIISATSCTHEELDAVHDSEFAQVSFTLGVDNAVGTKALISDGTKADKLVYAVYKLNGQKEAVLQNVVGTNKNSQFIKTGFKSGDNVSVTLAKGQTYQVAFWAQDGDCTAYNTDDLRAVKVSYKTETENGTDNAKNNDELRDAFFKMVEFTVSGNKSIDVVMERPFAQINVGVTNADWTAAVRSGITIDESSVIITKAHNTINLLTGETTGEEVVTYALNDIPEETLYVETNAAHEGKEEYKWLSMNYILVPQAKTTLESLQFTFSPVSGNDIKFTEGLNTVPVQRNWRTNILGKILTGDIQFNVTIDPVYDGEVNYPQNNKNVQELEFAATFGGTVNMTSDVVLSEPLNVAADMILNMNGNTLSGSVNLLNGASLTVENGTIQNTNNTVSGITSNGNLTLKDVNVESARHALRIESGNVVINGGIYKVEPAAGSSMTIHALNVGDKGTVANVTIKDGTFIGPKGTNADSGAAVSVYSGSSVTIEGGNFSGGKNKTIDNKGTMTITGGTFDQEPNSTWVADGRQVVESNGKWYVGAITVTDNAELKSAIADVLEGKVIVLSKDVNYGSVTVGQLKDVVIIGAENSVMTFNTDADTKIDNVTLKTINFVYDGSNVNSGIVISADAEINNLTIENCTFTGTGEKKGRGLYGQNVNATIIFKGCLFKNLGYPIYTMSAGGYKSLTVENCEFELIKSWAIMPQYDDYTGDLTVKGCTFTNCTGGLVKTGSFTAGHTFIFVNNTISNSTEHPSKNWFSVNVTAGNAIISGNTKDGVSWTPGKSEGLTL